MSDKRIRVPGPLKVLHGEVTCLSALIATYSAVVVTGLLVAFVPSAGPESRAAWRVILVAVLAADIAGGVVANFTSGTDAYYAARPGTKVGFTLAHVVQPALLWLACGGELLAWATIAAYTVVAALAVDRVRNRDRQQSLAAALVAAGIALSMLPALQLPVLWFAPLYLTKLILGFSVRRTGDTSGGAAPMGQNKRRRETAAVALRPVDQEGFAAFLEISIPDYADECVKMGKWPPEGALARSAAEHEKLLPDGAETADQHISRLVGEGNDIGYVWWAPEPKRPDRAFIYLVYLHEHYRGRGFGVSAMAAAEDSIRAQGYGAVGLHVFTFNEPAVRLYRSRGFATTDLVMLKELR